MLRALQALDEAREAAGKWERQFQEALGQQERLKDLLEESALWRAGGAQPENNSSADPAEARAGGEGAVSGPARGAGEAAAASDGGGAHLAALEQRYVQVARTAFLGWSVHAAREDGLSTCSRTTIEMIGGTSPLVNVRLHCTLLGDVPSAGGLWSGEAEALWHVWSVPWVANARLSDSCGALRRSAPGCGAARLRRCSMLVPCLAGQCVAE